MVAMEKSKIYGWFAQGTYLIGSNFERFPVYPRKYVA